MELFCNHQEVIALIINSGSRAVWNSFLSLFYLMGCTNGVGEWIIFLFLFFHFPFFFYLSFSCNFIHNLLSYLSFSLSLLPFGHIFYLFNSCSVDIKHGFVFHSTVNKFLILFSYKRFSFYVSFNTYSISSGIYSVQ